MIIDGTGPEPVLYMCPNCEHAWAAPVVWDNAVGLMLADDETEYCPECGMIGEEVG